jgi:hypothetical protein
VVFLCKPNQILDQDDIAILGGNVSVIAPKHLVDFAIDEAETGLGQTLLERHEGQVKTILVVAEMPGFHVVAGNVIEFDLVQLMDAVVQDEGVLGGSRQVAEAATQVQTEGAAIGQETGCAGPVPKGLVFPGAASPIERTQAFVWFELFMLVAVAQRATGGQTVDFSVVLEAFPADGDNNDHGLVSR